MSALCYLEVPSLEEIPEGTPKEVRDILESCINDTFEFYTEKKDINGTIAEAIKDPRDDLRKNDPTAYQRYMEIDPYLKKYVEFVDQTFQLDAEMAVLKAMSRKLVNTDVEAAGRMAGLKIEELRDLYNKYLMMALACLDAQKYDTSYLFLRYRIPLEWIQAISIWGETENCIRNIKVLLEDAVFDKLPEHEEPSDEECAEYKRYAQELAVKELCRQVANKSKVRHYFEPGDAERLRKDLDKLRLDKKAAQKKITPNEVFGSSAKLKYDATKAPL